MRYTFPKRTNDELMGIFRKNTLDKPIKERKEFIAPLCIDEKNNICLGNRVNLGDHHSVGRLPVDDIVCSGKKWAGEIHSHPKEKALEVYGEFLQGASDDDTNHIVSKVFTGHYHAFPILFCIAQLDKESSQEVDVEVQCEKWRSFTDKDIIGMPRSAKPRFESDFDKYYPSTVPFTEKQIGLWKQHGGYPALVDYDINEFARKHYENPASIPIVERIKGEFAIFIYQGDMASIKKNLKERGKLTTGSFMIHCSVKEVGRSKKKVYLCDTKEQSLEL